MDSLIGDSFSIPARLPLSSPVSPILFMLFIQPMFFLGTLVRKQVLQEDFKLLNSWAADEGLIFDIGKSELAHFTR
ncbi:hypothetical protein VTO42DRAFT_1129 [Malbranchea cinnamomea]